MFIKRYTVFTSAAHRLRSAWALHDDMQIHEAFHVFSFVMFMSRETHGYSRKRGYIVFCFLMQIAFLHYTVRFCS